MKTTKPTQVVGATFLITLAVGLLVPSSGDAQTVGNPEFSTPPLDDAYYQYRPSASPGQPWTFAGDSGVAQPGQNPDVWITVADTNYPGQYAFLQLSDAGNGYGSISQTVSVNSTGTFKVSFLEAGRVHAPSGAGGDLKYTVEVRPSAGGISVLSVTNASATAQPFIAKAHQFIIPTQGDYTISFVTLSHNGPEHDNTAIIDNVSLSHPPDDDLLATIHVSAVDICWAGRTNQMYQVQYLTNVSDTNWFDFGSPVLGTGTNCVTDGVNGIQQRYYRIVRLP